MIDHPSNSSKILRHICLKSPTVDVFYRNKVKLDNGTATININSVIEMSPGTFSALSENHLIFLINNSNWDQVKIKDESTLLNGEFTIISDNPKSSIVVDWLVMAKRINIESDET